MVRHVQSAWRLALVWRGCVRHHLAASRGVDPAGWEQRWLCDGVCAVGRGDHLESRHMVAWATSFQLAYSDWVDYWRRRNECAPPRARRYIRRGLVEGDRDWIRVAPVPVVWFF